MKDSFAVYRKLLKFVDWRDWIKKHREIEMKEDKNIKPLKQGEAEVYLRTNDEGVMKILLPAELVEEFKVLQKQMKADDLLEVLIKSTGHMIRVMSLFKFDKKD